MEYNFKEIEAKWQRRWQEEETYRVEADPTRPKFYVLDMFPYPSGAGLHVGHPLGYIASDIYSRYKRLCGFNVLHPMGYDAFGLPAEQYAIQTGQHPAVTTERNIARYREQLDKIGFSFDWHREVRTCDPSYYKWTQWAFLEMFKHYYDRSTDKAEPIEKLVARFEAQGTEGLDAACTQEMRFTADEWKSKTEEEREQILQNYRLAFRADTMVNWCPQLGTVLANDEVKDGLSERGGFPVEQKRMKHVELSGGKGMLAIERQEQIVSQIRRNGAVRIHELTKQFSVSVETIRRDLLELERQDCLHRVHGGAVGIAVAKQYHRLEERTEENPQKKEELSGYAAGLIREGDVLMVDSGSTAIAFAKMLAEEFERLTVITYSLHVFEILKKKEGFTLYLCAGAYLRDENAFCGQWALQMLEQFHAKTAFLFPSAISLQNGIMDYDQELYHLQRAMMKHADRSVFLADSDKFEKSALLKLADVNEAVTFVTDSGLRKEILELYQENGIEMIRGEQKQ